MMPNNIKIGNYSGLLLPDLPKEREPAKVQL
jgi:hypothetical protein